MKEFFAYPVTDEDGVLSLSDYNIGIFTEQIFIDPETLRIEAGSKPVMYLYNTEFSVLFGEIPCIEGRKISIS